MRTCRLFTTGRAESETRRAEWCHGTKGKGTGLLSGVVLNLPLCTRRWPKDEAETPPPKILTGRHRGIKINDVSQHHRLRLCKGISEERLAGDPTCNDPAASLRDMLEVDRGGISCRNQQQVCFPA